MSFPRSSRARRLLAAVAALMFVVAACGDDSDSTSTADTTSTTMAAQDDGGDAGVDHHEPVDVSDLDPAPTVTVEVTQDPMSGWNLHLEVTGHTFAPEHASTDHVPGEGHAHLYVDGEKVTRLYAEDFFLGELAAGEHEVTVELSANDHRPLAVDGEMVSDTVMVEVGAATSDTAHDDDAQDMSAADPGGSADAFDGLTLVVAGGAVSGDTGRQEVAVGDTVQIEVTSDVADHVHVHGYDLFTDVAPDEAVVIEFVADIPGAFEIELEDSGLLLVELLVA